MGTLIGFVNPDGTGEGNWVTPQDRINERGFLADVVALLRLHGWLTYHTYDSRRSDPGFPDLVAVRGSRMLAMELKMPKGRVTPQQQQWIMALSGVWGVEAFVLRYAEDMTELERLIR